MMGHARRNLGHAERAAHVEALLADAAPLHDVLDAASVIAGVARTRAERLTVAAYAQRFPCPPGIGRARVSWECGLLVYLSAYREIFGEVERQAWRAAQAAAERSEA